MLDLEILFWSCAVISIQETSGSGALLAVVFSIAVAAYGEEINRIKGCDAFAVLRGKYLWTVLTLAAEKATF